MNGIWMIRIISNPSPTRQSID